MLAFLLGRWIGTGLMIRFRPQDMLLVYALVNILLCAVVAVCEIGRASYRERV